ncbi:MAG: Glycine cleavage system H protein [Candidatus Marinimicrobia bacterium]|nr:Glycine cleavage system H protein [Candidatus Neomarinimicrobiota bacterium]
MDYPENLLYTEEHEWADYNEDAGTVTIGITDFAQSELGDIVFLELPDVSEEISAGDVLGTIEAVKTVADIYSPVSGTVSGINEELEDSPELVNDDPFGDGWIVKVTVSEPAELEELLSIDEYKKLID